MFTHAEDVGRSSGKFFSVSVISFQILTGSIDEKYGREFSNSKWAFKASTAAMSEQMN